MKYAIDSEIFDLLNQLRQIKDKADAVAAHQHDLNDRLQAAEAKARELHQKILDEQFEVGGEG